MGTYEGMTVEVVWDTPGLNNFNYTALATDELIQGYGGADTIYGNALDNYIFGDQRGDRPDFDATADGADILYGFGGDDVIDPGAGSGNYVNGGDDVDTLDYRFVTPGQTLTVDLKAGTADAGSYGSTLVVNVENVYGTEDGINLIHGDGTDNQIHGGAFGDRLYGRDGKDLLLGFDGNDVLRGGKHSDKLQGGEDNDKLFGGTGRDTLIGGAGNDTMKGEKGNDHMIGARGKDRMYGGKDDDFIDGRKGRDVIIAGSGDDTLYGGEGSDKFVFNKYSEDNRIMDFEATDRIQIDSGAQSIFELKFTDTSGGLWVEFGSVSIFLKGLDLSDIGSGTFLF
ncbi:MAG: hypothetical protein KDK28_18415 [Maritimibacter sp.]|nr:hypothetical protein [Maritimibacter sp.]